MSIAGRAGFVSGVKDGKMNLGSVATAPGS